MQSGFSALDHLYHAIVMSSKFFASGWGKPENLSRLFQMRRRIMNKEICQSLLNKAPTTIIIEKKEDDSHFEVYDGHFKSPFAINFPEFVPEPVAMAKFQMILPKKWSRPVIFEQSNPNATLLLKPMCLQLAGTGDHFFWRRRVLIAKPLAKNNNVGSILLENPYYGLRKPTNQKRSSLCNVTDLFIMGGCLTLECLFLLDWCEKQGYGPLALTGISMGGHMCSLAACNYSKPVALVPCLSWSTASCVFTQGVLSNTVAWKNLQSQYFSDEFQKQENIIISALKQNIKTTALQLVETCSTENKPLSLSNETKIKLSIRKLKFLIDLFDLSYFNNKNGRKLTASCNSEVLEFMREVMDEFTHLARFSKPVDPSLIIVVCAGIDAYVPRDRVASLSEIWPEAEIRYIKDKGHVGAFLFNQTEFRTAIVDALNRTAQKYYLKNKTKNKQQQKIDINNNNDDVILNSSGEKTRAPPSDENSRRILLDKNQLIRRDIEKGA